jgi:hypothetical protein
MDEKKGKSRVIILANCMWCDFFNNSKCDLKVKVKVVKEEKLYARAPEPHRTYAAADYKECLLKRTEYNNGKKK